MNPMMNNPMMNNPMIQAAMSGASAMQFLQQMAGQNPMVSQAMSLIQGKNTEQLQQIAENMARQRGTTIEEIARQYGLPMNKNP